MFNMMNTTGIQYGFITLWGLHILSVIAFFVGLIFLVVLAIKTFTPAQLKSWAIWLMVGGTVVCLFTIGVLGRPWIGMRFGGPRNKRHADRAHDARKRADCRFCRTE